MVEGDRRRDGYRETSSLRDPLSAHIELPLREALEEVAAEMRY